MAGYDLVEQLSVSGDVETWRGKDRRDADIVIKRFPVRDLVAFTARTGSLVRLDSPHVAPLLDRRKEGEQLLAVRDYFPAGSLRDVASSLDTSGKLRVCAQIARALERAHLHGLVHGAVKPENIVFADDRRAMLVDFSIASAAPGSFSPPESATDPRSDQWSLAAVACFLLLGHIPSGGERLSSDAALNRALQRSLAPSVTDRFRRIDELASAFELAGEQGGDDSTGVRVERKENVLRVHVAGRWTPRVIETCLRDIDQAVSRFSGVFAIGYVLDAIGGNHSQAIDAIGDLHRRHRARIGRVCFVSHSPQTRGACILIGTRGDLEWKTFASAETMDPWLRGGAA